MATSRTSTATRAFSLVEMIVVIGVIALLLGLLFPAINKVRKTGLMTDSMSRMRQIGIWMRQYSSDNRETMLPSTFDYSGFPPASRGKVRSAAALGQRGLQHKGTWADILWTVYELGVFPGAQTTSLGQDYSTDSPDKGMHQLDPDIRNPLRSAAANSRNRPAGDSTDSDPRAPTPFGNGAVEIGLPGYFAANQFFDSRQASNTIWYSTGQIKTPDRSMYLVDSWAGETIEDTPEPFETLPQSPSTSAYHYDQVDFRYGDACLMLFLDAHVDPVVEFESLDELETKRQIKVRDLIRN